MSLLAKQVPFKIREHCGPKLASLVRYSVIYDQRDNPVFPTQGLMLKSVNEYCGLGGNVAYMSSTTHGEISVPLVAGLVAQVCGRIGVIKETKNTTVLPISRLFYCGGPLTLRGFKYGGAGPVVEGTSIGAQVRFSLVAIYVLVFNILYFYFCQTHWCTGLHLWGPLPFSHVFKGLANNFRTHLFYNCGGFNSFSTGMIKKSFFF